MSDVKPKTYVHFYRTTKEVAPEDGVDPIEVDAYSWYLQKSDGGKMTVNEELWESPEAAISDAESILGVEFWKEDHYRITESWYRYLVNNEPLPMPKYELYLPAQQYTVEDYKFMSQDSPTTTKSDLDVNMIQLVGSDQMICQAARVSTLGEDSLETEESAGLINFLIKNRHGSPFEHGLMTFRITAPIFVWREFMRHRIGFSYNEQSGRYMELEAMAYIPMTSRRLVQIGKPGAYEFVPGTPEQYEIAIMELTKAYDQAWTSYHNMLDAGIAKEVARICLPVATYSTAYVTCNPRSLMSFLSLRTQHEDSTFPSYPQHEIRVVADRMEFIFAEFFPLTHAAFKKNGRVAP